MNLRCLHPLLAIAASFAVAASADAQAPAPQAQRPPGTPPPARRIAPIAIPDVPRDQVIGFCLYTTQRGVLKLTAQLYPLRDREARKVALEIERDGRWSTAG